MNPISALSYPWQFARNFPGGVEQPIDRPHYLETIFSILTNENPIVFLEGEEGEGATTTLAQFCEKYPDRTFALFVRPSSRFTYGIEYLRKDLADQLFWYVNGTQSDKASYEESEYETLVQRVLSKSRNTPLYFVVDGLHQIPAGEEQILTGVFRDLLPVGVSNCRFLITGLQQNLARYLLKAKSKPYQQLRFQPEETERFLRQVNISSNEAVEIHRLCKGIPGNLASVRRLLSRGAKFKDVLDVESGRYLEFVRLEFSKLDLLSQEQRHIAAIITFSKMPLLVQTLAEIVGVSPTAIQETILHCPYIAIDQNTGAIDFLSQTHRRIATNRLETEKNRALQAQIDHMIAKPSSQNTIRFLPTYFAAMNRQEEVVALLSNEHFEKLLEETESLAALRNRAEMGAKSAEQLRKSQEAFKFGIQKSLFIAIAGLESTAAEIDALVSLGRPDDALEIANCGAAKEARLALLAKFARGVREKNGLQVPGLTEKIRSLAAEISFEELGDKAVKIASNVLFFDPDLAISIIESAFRGSSSAAKDEALTQLSITATISKISSPSSLVEDKARHQISDEALQEVAASFATLSESLDSPSVIQTVEKMDSRNRIFFLRSLVAIRRNDKSILDIVEYALDCIVKETSYVPKARDLAELAAPLSSDFLETGRVQKIIARFDSQIGLLEKTAFSRDLAVFQMRLALAERKISEIRCCQRLEAAYYDIAAIVTPEVKLECYAVFLSALREIDSDEKLEVERGYRQIVKTDLNILVDEVLERTGDNLSAVKGALKALSLDYPDFALDIAQRLNTESRRSRAYAIVAVNIATLPHSQVVEAALRRAVELIEDVDTKSLAIGSLTRPLSAGPSEAKWAEKLEDLGLKIESPYGKCRWYLWILHVSLKNGNNADVGPLLDAIDQQKVSIDSPMQEADIYFLIAAAIAGVDAPKASEYYAKGIECKTSKASFSTTASRLLGLCLKLVARSLSALAKSGSVGDDLRSRFLLLVDRMPGTFAKIDVLCDFVEHLWWQRGLEDATSIVAEKVLPLIEQSRADGSYNFRTNLARSIPTLTLTHRASALSYCDAIPGPRRSQILFDAAMMRLRKLPISEPVSDGAFDCSKLERDDILSALELVDKISTDSAIFQILREIVEAINDKANRSKFSGQQKKDIAARCFSIVTSKLPDLSNIRHEGFRILGEALVLTLGESTFIQWKDLQTRASKIANVADCGYVLMYLARFSPRKFEHLRKELLEQALLLFKQIPSQVDRLSHFADYASEAFRNDDAATSKEVLRLSMQLAAEIGKNSESVNHRREIIDIADQISPQFADELVDSIDDDPARAPIREENRKMLATRKERKKLANAKTIRDVNALDIELLPEAAWQNLGLLQSGKLALKSAEVMTAYLSQARHRSFLETYPVLCWYVENESRRYNTKLDVESFVAPIAESLLLSTELAQTILMKVTATKFETSSKLSTNLMVGRNDRDKALAFVAEWLRKNARETIVVCDPYFRPDDVSFLRLALSEAPSSKVQIITSRREQSSVNPEAAFLAAWKSICEQEPPDTEIFLIAEHTTGRMPIHDRWLLSGDVGLRIGTSYGSIGNSRLSEISEMNQTECSECSTRLSHYLSKKRFVDGERVSYLTFTL